ncbi:hypothetical protein BDA99DRAFT_494301 [Phascolomyces articulosus]|uniref:Uncharacterized protein n=1 Tax=Phascolomyces articulosus TaxID=60185 RepID=A0AAD5KNA0_9FUNG|nr:hypothetical protein BDA99DRAFT_494301 [Phascolomyces articulosus]
MDQDFARRYYWSRLLTPPKCCGCFNNRFGSGMACFIWAGFSFYFAVLAFMQKSPFYSYLNEVPLIIFGVVNLIFGCISIGGFVVVFFLPYFTRVRTMTYVIAICAILVLISTLVNFILFTVNQGSFQQSCVSDARNAALQSFHDQTGNTTISIGTDTDYYNCDRLFANQVKWSLLCVIAMYIVYIHWMLVFAGFAGTSFFLIPPRPTPFPPMGGPPIPPSMAGEPMPPPTSVIPPTELSNLPPSSSMEKDQQHLNTFYNLKPKRKTTTKKKQIDPNLLSVLGLKVNETGRVIHIADNDCLPRYTSDLQYYNGNNDYYYYNNNSKNKKKQQHSRQPSSSSKTYAPSSDEDDLR